MAVCFVACLRVRSRKLKWVRRLGAGWEVVLEATLPTLDELGMDGRDTSVMRAKALDLSGVGRPDVEF